MRSGELTNLGLVSWRTFLTGVEEVATGNPKLPTPRDRLWRELVASYSPGGLSTGSDPSARSLASVPAGPCPGATPQGPELGLL